MQRPEDHAPFERGFGGESRRWWAFAALALVAFAVRLDATVLNVALPELSTSLHATTGQLQWFSDAYTLAVGVAMLPAVNLGDEVEMIGSDPLAGPCEVDIGERSHTIGSRSPT